MADSIKSVRGKRIMWAVTGCLVTLVAFRLFFHAGDQSNKHDGGLFKVRQGPLVINVVESGTVKPSDQLIIKSELEGVSTILYLIPEGTVVKKGDLLVELDASGLVDSKVDQEIKVQNAEADLVESRENLAVVKNQSTADLEQAELNLRFAKEDLQKYKDGEYPNNLKEVKGKITLVEEELERADDTLTWSKKLFAEKYISQTELKADELAAQKSQLDLELAKSELDLLVKYTHKRQLDQLMSDVRQAEMGLERIRRKSSADVVQAEARLRAREAEYNRQKGKLDKLAEQILKAKITAPADGTVVYATSATFSFRGNVEPLEEGQQVRERQELIYLPKTSTFIAEVKIHESSLKKIYEGLPVRITVDALPGKTFTGKITRIAPLPDAQSMFMNPDLKVYDTDVTITGGGDVLRTGMTCQVEIIIAQYEHALSVPVQCVVRVNGKPTVYVYDAGQTTPREVDIGLDNNSMVRVIKGLSVGEEVLLTPPLDNGGFGAGNPPMKKLDIPSRPQPLKSGERLSPSKVTDTEEKKLDAAAKRRQRFANMTPEERQAAKEKWRKKSGGSKGE